MTAPRLLALLAVLTLAALTFRIFAGREAPALEERTRVTPVMGTFATCIVVAPPGLGEPVLDAMDSLARHLDRELSFFSEDGELHRLNASGAGAFSAMSPHLRGVLETSLGVAAATDSLFDPSLGALVLLWDFAGTPSVPPDSLLEQALSVSGLSRLETDGDSLRLAPGMLIDLGAMAPGYASDALYDLALSRGAVAALVEIGGEVRCGGEPSAGRTWTVAIRDPRNGGVLEVMELEEGAVATSGDYESCFFDDSGTRLCHILDPGTGRPETGVASATVVARACGRADALATALCVGGIPLAERLPDSLFREILLITRDGDGGTSLWRRRSAAG